MFYFMILIVCVWWKKKSVHSLKNVSRSENKKIIWIKPDEMFKRFRWKNDHWNHSSHIELVRIARLYTRKSVYWKIALLSTPKDIIYGLQTNARQGPFAHTHRHTLQLTNQPTKKIVIGNTNADEKPEEWAESGWIWKAKTKDK